MLSRFLGTGAGHIALGLRSEPDIAVSDTTPERPPNLNNIVELRPDHEANLDNDSECGSDEGSLISSESEDGCDEGPDGLLAMDAPSGDDGWVDDDDVEPEDEDPLFFDYDYSN